MTGQVKVDHAISSSGLTHTCHFVISLSASHPTGLQVIFMLVDKTKASGRSMTERQKGIQVHRPIIYGSHARLLSEEEKQSAPPGRMSTYLWVVTDPLRRSRYPSMDRLSYLRHLPSSAATIFLDRPSTRGYGLPPRR